MGFETTICGFVVEPRERVSPRRDGWTNNVPKIKVFDTEFGVLDLDFAIYARYLVDTIVECEMLQLDLWCG